MRCETPLTPMVSVLLGTFFLCLTGSDHTTMVLHVAAATMLRFVHVSLSCPSAGPNVTSVDLGVVSDLGLRLPHLTSISRGKRRAV